MSEKYILAIAIWISASVAIAVACFSTKSASPLWAYVLVGLATESLII